MTNRSLFGAWGSGDSAGDLILPGNHGGGYGDQTAHFFKMHDGSGTAITDAKTNVTSGTASGLSWDSSNGTVVGSAANSSPTFTLSASVASQDLIFIGVVNLTSSSFAIGFGNVGLAKGFKFDNTSGLTFKNDTGGVAFAATKAIPIGEDIVFYIYIDDSAGTSGELAWGWVSATDSSHEAAAALAGGSATAFTPSINLTLVESYSMSMLYYPEPAASLATIKTAAEMFVQHRSDECKADPTKRIIYPGLI